MKLTLEKKTRGILVTLVKNIIFCAMTMILLFLSSCQKKVLHLPQMENQLEKCEDVLTASFPTNKGSVALNSDRSLLVKNPKELDNYILDHKECIEIMLYFFRDRHPV